MHTSIQLTYGLQDMGLVEILCSKGHPLANKDGIFCTYTLICYWPYPHGVRIQLDKFYESPILQFLETQIH